MGEKEDNAFNNKNFFLIKKNPTRWYNAANIKQVF